MRNKVMKIYNYTVDKNGLRTTVYECSVNELEKGILRCKGMVFRLKNEGIVLNKNSVFFREPNVEEAAKRILEARREILKKVEEQAERERSVQRMLALSLQRAKEGSVNGE